MRPDRNRQSGFRLSRLELVTGGIVAIGALAIVVAERRRPLRRRTQPGPDREFVNLAMGAASALAIMAAETPLVGPLARIAEERNRGLVRRLPLPEWGRDVAGLLLMDYTFYLWHVLTHKVPLLWRLHLVHHVDLDLDASTALRFHALDMVVSAPWRAGQVALIGLSPRGLRLWQRFFFLSILFHHSNLRLPEGLERRLAWVLTTPGCMASIIPRPRTRPTRTGRAASASGTVCTARSASTSIRTPSPSGYLLIAIPPKRASADPCRCRSGPNGTTGPRRQTIAEGWLASGRPGVTGQAMQSSAGWSFGTATRYQMNGRRGLGTT